MSSLVSIYQKDRLQPSDSRRHSTDAATFCKCFMLTMATAQDKTTALIIIIIF